MLFSQELHQIKVYTYLIQITLENLAYLTQEDLSYEDFVKTIFISLDKASAKYVEDLAIYPGFENSPEPILKELNASTVVMELFHGPTNRSRLCTATSWCNS